MSIYPLAPQTINRLDQVAQARGLSADELINRLLDEAEEANQYQKWALEATLSGVLVADAQQPDMPIVYVNPAFEALTGYTAEEVIGQNCRFLQGDDRDQPGLDILREALAAGEGCAVQLRNYRKDGTLFWNELQISPAFDDDGDLTHFIGVQDDVTDRVLAEEALRESEARYRAVSELSFDYAFALRVNPDGSLTREWITSAFKQVTGFTPEESESRGGWASLIHPDDFAPAMGTLKRILTEGVVTPLEYRIITKSGEVRYLHGDFEIEREPETGRICRIYGVSHDITEQKISELQLLESERSLQQQNRLLNAINEVQLSFIAGLSTPDLFNDLLGHILKLTGSEFGFIGNIFIDEEGQPYLKTRALTNIAWDDATRAFYDSHMPYDMEFRNLHTLFGQVITTGEVLMTNDPVHHPSSGGLPPGHPPLHNFLGIPIKRGLRQIGMIGMANRLGGYDEAVLQTIQPFLATCANLMHASNNEELRRRIEIELRKSEEKFRKILELASEGILIADGEGKIVLANRRAEKIFAYQHGELNHQPIEMLVPHEFRAGHGTLRDGMQGLRKDGSVFPVEISLSYVEVDREQLVMCLAIDITERKQLEEQRLANQALQIELAKEREIIELKERFVSMISHEFRTPLSVMMTTTDILERYHNRLSPERFSKHLQELTRQVHYMVEMLDSVLTLSRANAGKLVYQPESFDLETFCYDLVEKYRLLDGGEHRIDTWIDPMLARFQGDKRLLEHVLTNLFSNALKYSPEGTSIYFAALQDDDGSVVLEVADKGIGIPLEDQKRLFEPFHRARNAANIDGTGLGLAIVKNSVEMHGGSIDFESVPGEGTTFTIRLPIENQLAERKNGG